MGEIVAAFWLAVIAWRLPDGATVEQGFSKSERVARHTAAQVRLVREQLHDLRRPEVSELATQIRDQTRTVTATLKAQPVDYDTLRTMRDALGDVALGLDGVASTLDPKQIGALGDGLGATADFLENKVVPAAEQAAKRLEDSTATLRESARQLSSVLRATPLDMRSARDVGEGLARFSEGIDAMRKTLPVERLKTMRDGFDGLETSLSTAARQVDGLAGLTYPAVTWKGVRPEITHRKLWPDGEGIADGMRKAAVGVTAAGQELDALGLVLPKLHRALDDSQQVLTATRTAIESALTQRATVEPLLRDLPTQLARLADELPRLSGDLAGLLRDTRPLRDAAGSMRHAHQGIAAIVLRWPDLRRALGSSAGLLRTTRAQLDFVLANRAEYETAQKQTVRMGETLAALLPLYTEQLDARLRDQEESLDELGRGVDEVGDTLPALAHTAVEVLWLSRGLLFLVAGLVAVHGSGTMVASGAWGRGRVSDKSRRGQHVLSSGIESRL